jgi:DNA primase
LDIKILKDYIYENNKIVEILESINCHHIKWHSKGYWTAANFDGTNQQAIIIYNQENLKCINYTRDLTNGKSIPTDIISLVCFNKQLSFSEGIKYLCDLFGLDYYKNYEEDIPESLRITKLIYSMQQDDNDIDENKPLKPISENILTYYKHYVNDMFFNDGISYEIQREFEIGYDPESNRITIPIRDELGNLIGVKARLFKQNLNEGDLKYLYIEPCARNKILYGLYKTHPYIKQEGQCIITEAEKGVLQLWSYGYFNSIGIGGTQISQNQIEKMTRLGVDLIFAFDKGVTKKDIENIANRFVDGVEIFYLWDEKNILEDKESPSDKKEKFEFLFNNYMYKIK